MKAKILPFEQIERWLMTLLFFFIILTNTLGGMISLESLTDSNKNLTPKYFAYIFIPLCLYAAFYLMHVKILPAYRKDRKKGKFALHSLLTVLGSWTLVTFFHIIGRFVGGPFKSFFIISVVIAIYLGYNLAVRFLDQLFRQSQSTNYFLYNTARCIILYTFVMIFLLRIQDVFHHFILIFYIIIIPVLSALMLYNYFLIYRMKAIGKDDRARTFFFVLPVTVFVIFLATSIVFKQPEPPIFGALATLFIVAVFNPFAQWLFSKYDRTLGQIGTLTNILDQKSADLQFLRSQINPHFLFNALNSIYGTALRENAEKTGEGIQKLGDMMRFMLHENNQDSIALEREKEYLVNYVDLQQLRTGGEENIDIVLNRPAHRCNGQIAPMMLIPFVENAFKHGISLQKKSWVKISLRCAEGSVHLDINNSIHRKSGQDPEKASPGIGLENVRKRLNLIYPQRHDLVIRENDLEYFVHLSIQLTPNA
ncbi:MAG TPA: histidine kinase [Cyclobacteriaceae bacterium]|nr:histidine kinase [Cyclobacteriaceae bacterium]